MVLDHHIFNTSEEIQPQLLKATPLYIIMDIVSLTVNHTLSNHMVFTLREKNEWLYSLKCKALYLTFWCEKPHWARSWGCWAPLASSGADRSWRHSTTCWINLVITKSSLQSNINTDSHFTSQIWSSIRVTLKPKLSEKMLDLWYDFEPRSLKSFPTQHLLWDS